MSSEPVERRLTAILAADVAGYSRLIGADEEGTLAQLKAFRKTLVDPTIAKHRGRIVKTTGDGMLDARSMCSSMHWNSATSGSMASIRQRPADPGINLR